MRGNHAQWGIVDAPACTHIHCIVVPQVHSGSATLVSIWLVKTGTSEPGLGCRECTHVH